MIKKILPYLLFVLILCIPVMDLFHSGLPLTHDGQDHVARIANFYMNLQNGIIIPRWAPNLNFGYGHPILEFLYPLPSYIASLFHLTGFSLFDSAKIVFGIGMFFSGITMYLWLSQFLSKKASFVGGLLYVFAPYRFIDLYVRGDIGENLAFVFMPLILYFLIQASRKQNYWYIVGGAVSFACLILSHNAIALMYLPFIIFYGFYLIFQSKNKKFIIRNSLFIILLGFGLSAFFWIPGLLEAKFTLRNIVTKGIYETRFVTIPSLIYGPWNYLGSGQFTVQLGILHWLAFIASTFLIFIKKSRYRLLIFTLILYTIASLFLMLPISHFIWQRILLLQNFQFPWRFLAIPVFTGAVLAGVVVHKIGKKVQLAVVVMLVIAILLINKEYWHASGYSHLPERFFSGIYHGTTDTGESAPIWSVRFMEHAPKAPMEVIGGNAYLAFLQRKTNIHVYKVTAVTNAQLLENTVYFPGWEVLVDGKKTTIEYQSAVNRGLMTFFVTPGMHRIVVQYKETQLRFISDSISFVCLLGLGGFVAIGIYKKKI